MPEMHTSTDIKFLRLVN